MLLLKLIAISLMMMSSCAAWNILVIAPHPSYYRWIYFEKLIDDLLQNGHSITAFTPYPRVEEIPIEKYTQIEIEEFQIDKYYTSKDFFVGKFESDFTHIKTMYQLGLGLSEYVLNNAKIRQFISKKNLNFDLVIADHIPIDSLFMLSLKYKCPLVTIGLDGHVSYMDEAMGIVPSFSIVPHSSSKFDYKMTFMQRSYNALLYMYETAIRKFSYLPAQNKLAKRLLKDSFTGVVPDISEVKISAIITNTHRDFNTKPKTSTQLDIPGIQIKPIKALPDDLQSIYDSANEVIYFSFGSLNLGEMPKVKLDAILEALGASKKTVFMQYEGEKPANLPKNVYTKYWFPQNDILAKSKMLLFITHGGTLSYHEALKNRCPMIIIPFTGEQYRNGKRVEREKNGAMIAFDDLNAKLLSEKIIEVTSAPYLAKAKEVQIAFNANPIDPVKEAMFYIDNIIRNQGAANLETAHLSCIQRSGLDVLGFYFVIFLSVVGFWVLIILWLVQRYRKKQEKGKFKYY